MDFPLVAASEIKRTEYLSRLVRYTTRGQNSRNKSLRLKRDRQRVESPQSVRSCFLNLLLTLLPSPTFTPKTEESV